LVAHLETTENKTMTTKKTAGPSAADADRPSGVWGKKAAQFYAELRNQPVIVLTTCGERYAGTLIGVDVYDLIIRQLNGLEMLLSKGNIVYVHRSASAGTGGEAKA